MRLLRIIAQWLLILIGSAVIALTLFIAVQQLYRPAGLEQALLGGLIPITALKWPWLVVIAVVVVSLWLALRRRSRRQGVLRAIWAWVVRLGMSWSAAALLLLIGVIVDGWQTRNLADLNWPFALGSLGTAAALLVLCAVGWARTRPADEAVK